MSECERCGEAEWEVIVGPMQLCEVCAEVVEELTIGRPLLWGLEAEEDEDE